MQILDLNTKTIENRLFIHYLKRFLQTLSVCFLMLTSKHNYISVFCDCYPKFQCFYVHFQESLFVSITNFHQFGHTFSFLNGPEKKPKQNSTKTKRHSQLKEEKECSPTSAKETFFGALSQGLCADWLVCIAFCIFWHLIGSDQLSYFSEIGQFAYLIKESPIWNSSN